MYFFIVGFAIAGSSIGFLLLAMLSFVLGLIIYALTLGRAGAGLIEFADVRLQGQGTVNLRWHISNTIALLPPATENEEFSWFPSIVKDDSWRSEQMKKNIERAKKVRNK